eukprot:GILJ01000924.1.p1 GENE.GILJ01000924.1~~GILJ01000924.1.p1  ORF type:complete len:297 (+),score=45.41 GILJ01000924.1:218-1108(+)
MFSLECDEELPQTNFNELNEVNEPELFPEYNAEIVVNLLRLEKMRRPDPAYLANTQNAEITPAMRKMVVDWMHEEAEDLGLSGHFFALAVRFLDLYLSREKITKTVYQLAAAACLVLAAKVEEHHIPSFERLFDPDVGYTKKDLQKMEVNILHKLNWSLAVVTPHELVDRLLHLVPVAEAVNIKSRAAILIDMALCEYDFLCHSASTVAVSSVLCACEMLDRQDVSEVWMQQLYGMVKLDMADIVWCRQSLFVHLYRAFPELQPQDGKNRRDSASPTGVMEACRNQRFTSISPILC